MLLGSITDLEHPLPANPKGVARLQAAVDTVAQPPAAAPVPPLPAIAGQVSGRLYSLEPNVIGIDSVACTFDKPAEASLAVEINGQSPQLWVVGLDGIYRFASGLDGRPLGARGRWINEHTFVTEVNGVTTNDQFSLSFDFDGDGVAVQFREKYGGSAQIKGRMAAP